MAAQHLNRRLTAAMNQFAGAVGPKPIIVTLLAVLVGTLGLSDLFIGTGFYLAAILRPPSSTHDLIGLGSNLFILLNLVLFSICLALMHLSSTTSTDLPASPQHYVAAAKHLMSFTKAVAIAAMLISSSFLLLFLTSL